MHARVPPLCVHAIEIVQHTSSSMPGVRARRRLVAARPKPISLSSHTKEGPVTKYQAPFKIPKCRQDLTWRILPNTRRILLN